MTIIDDLIAINYSKGRSAKIKGIVLHSMDGYYKGTIAWFKNKYALVSAHYLISKEGEVRRMVKDQDTAWHAGDYNSAYIGIELEDERQKENWVYPEEQKKALKELVRDLSQKYGFPIDAQHILLHKNISSNRSDPVGNFDLNWIINSQQNTTMTAQDKKDIESMKKLREYKGVFYEAKDVIDYIENEKRERQKIAEANDDKEKKLIDKDKEIEKIKKDHTKELADKETVFEEAVKKLQDSVSTELAKMKETANGAYAERNNLVAFLSKLYPSYLAKHDPFDKTWEEEWKNIVYVDSPAGQLSWHIHVSELSKFSHLEFKANNWDGHTTEEKYRRLASIDPKKFEPSIYQKFIDVLVFAIKKIVSFQVIADVREQLKRNGKN